MSWRGAISEETVWWKAEVFVSGLTGQTSGHGSE
jgi:hypothetical protein